MKLICFSLLFVTYLDVTCYACGFFKAFKACFKRPRVSVGDQAHQIEIQERREVDAIREERIRRVNRLLQEKLLFIKENILNLAADYGEERSSYYSLSGQERLSLDQENLLTQELSSYVDMLVEDAIRSFPVQLASSFQNQFCYQILLELPSRMSDPHRKREGVSLATWKTKSVPLDSHQAKDFICPVCRGGLSDVDEIVAILPCEHMFCKDCATELSQRKMDCSLCRNTFESSD